jgi:YfiH family protein
LSLAVDWAAPRNIGVHCSTRDGGVSAGPYASLNLGDHVGDDPVAVRENRSRFSQALGARPVYLQQVHGTGVVRLDRGSQDGIAADACWTSERGIACTIMVADCMPLLFAGDAGRIVGAAHAGWRGLAHGVIEALWDALRGEGAQAASTQVWLGPCIGPRAFEVGEDVRSAFASVDIDADAFFKPKGGGKYLADLPGLARKRLQALGFERISGNDGSTAWCTVANPSRFFSHRRDRTSGRFAAAAWLR